MMHKVFQKFKQAYKRFKLRIYVPITALVIYTFVGAAVFRNFELEPDIRRRENYKNNTDYAFNELLKRMLEIRCMNQSTRFNNNIQIRHTKDVIFWFLDHLNLTEIVEERSNSNSPWSWMGALFFAGQLYTTIGYGIPVTVTSGGRIASLVYIMVGIPIFLIILKDVGQLLSRALRKLYKRIRSAKKHLPDRRRMAIYSLGISPLAMLGADLYNAAGNHKPTDQVDEEKAALDSDSTNNEKPNPPGILKKPAENGDLDPKKQNEINEKIHKKNHNFPILLALTILVIWILLSSALFCLWEKDWGFMTSVYFFFVSISTVGLGDIVPSKRDMMIVNFALILVGLALLSMCINLIQEAMERVINNLLEEYIREFEKIAEIVNTNDDFTEETLKPFEVEMTDMLTVPLTTIADDHHHGGIWEIGRNAKEWVAEQVANNILINRLYPPTYDSESSSDSSSEDEEEEKQDSLSERHDELMEVVVADDRKSTDDVPSISNTLNIRRSSQASTSTRETAAARDNISRASVKVQHKKEKKPKHHRLRQMNPFFNYNVGTLRAIQMIETAKLRTDRNPNFKSRLFAKFATNNRLTKLVDDRPHAKMVSFSVQTSPIVEREQRKPARMSYGVGLGSMDSFSSANQTNNDSATIKSFDIDSLCSSAYYDVNFHGYNTESVPQIIAQSTPPISHKNSTSPNRASLSSKPQTPPQSAGPIIKLDRTSQSPPYPTADMVSRQQRRRYSAANCLPIPISSSDKVHELPLLNSRMPLARCPSCSTVSTDTMPEPETIQRVRDTCGIMPADFQHVHKTSGSRPMSSMSEYENSTALDHSFHRHTAPSPPSKTPEQTSHIPVRHHQLHRSKRLDDSQISTESPAATSEPANEPQVKKHDSNSMVDSGLGELVKTPQYDSKKERESSD